MRCWIVVLLVLTWMVSAEEWVFLKDGGVGLSDGSKDPITVTLSNKARVIVKPEDILFRRSREQVDQAVLKIVADLKENKDVLTHLKELSVLHEAASAKLVECLAQDDTKTQIAALVGLQYGWGPQALMPVMKVLQVDDREIRVAAFKALTRNVPEVELAGRLQHFADGDDLDLAELVFELADKYHPDESLKRIKRILEDESGWAVAATRLSHYLSPDLTPATLRLLSDDRAFIRRGAVVGLIAQLADGEETRAKVRALLEDKIPDLREIAAEYFTWNGHADDLPALNKALETEKDMHAHASMAAAVKTIQSRDRGFSKKPELADQFKRLRDAFVLEPTFVYNVHEHDKKIEFRDRAYKLQDVLFASGGIQSSGTRFLDEVKIPNADKWVTPVRDYYDPGRTSFGYAVTKDFTAFVGSVHIGDDAGWNKELRTVVAVAPGIVRSVQHIFSWGFIVVIEHKDGKGEPYCSLFAHLSPMLHVKPGERVEAGQKIASIGRNHTVDNGGYHSHVHVGIHHGEYNEGNWTHGYISLKSWQQGLHDWMDPQKFLKERDAP